MKKIAIIGAGGFGQEVFCIWRDVLMNEGTDYQFIGFFDDAENLKNNFYGNVVGNINDLNQFPEELNIAIAIGNPIHLKSIKQKIKNDKILFPNIIHPTALFLDSDFLEIGQGNIFSAECLISCGVKIGQFNIFNTRATLGHHDCVGDYNVFSPNVQISGNVKIGNGNLFGFNSGVIQNKSIGEGNTLGAGSILLRNIKNNDTYTGNPAIKFKF